jgi:hypothetical protein
MFWLTLLLAAASAQSIEPSWKEEAVYGRPAFVLENGLIRIAALKGGGHLAEIRLLSSGPGKSVNPMRVPHYPTIDPTRYDAAKHDSLYSNTPHKWLHSGYMGHLLCFPFYGPPSSDDEARALLGNHGEAPIVDWKKLKVDQKPGALTLWYGAELPRTQYRVERAITLTRGAKHFLVEEWVENLTNYDRPFQWMQHATFGPPFVEPGKTFLDASATRGLTAGARPGAGSLQGNTEFYWPRGIGPDGKPADLRPMQPKPHAGTYYALQMDPSRQEQFFTLYHADYRLLIGYLFPTAQNPWLADWQENKSNTTLPWNGQAVARGLEFGNSPFAEGLRKAVDRAQLFGIPSYQWIGARQRLKNQFTVFLEEIPSGFAGVANARSTASGVELTFR